MKKRPILVQGAMIIEIKKIIDSLENLEEDTIGCYKYYSGSINDYPVVVCKTEMGMVNAAASTALGIEKYNPLAIINQGTAGAHDKRLRQYDIIIGTNSINIGSFRSDFKEEGLGITPSDWIPMKSSVVVNGRVRRVSSFKSDELLIDSARDVSHLYSKGKVYEGFIASADEWNKELDRLNFFNSNMKTLGEDMETSSCAQIAMSYSIPFIGIRVVSNNELHREVFAKDASDYSQEYVLNMINNIITKKLWNL